jgi:septal ring factor EnvC (AmiA/AmiB activator)
MLLLLLPILLMLVLLQVKAQAQQLELAHKQLDGQQQELRQLQEAAAGSSRTLAAMEQEKTALKDQIVDLKRELGAGEGGMARGG